METLPPEGTPVTIKDGIFQNAPYLAIIKEWVPSINKYTGEIECHHAIVIAMKGNYEQLIRVERLTFSLTQLGYKDLDH